MALAMESFALQSRYAASSWSRAASCVLTCESSVLSILVFSVCSRVATSMAVWLLVTNSSAFVFWVLNSVLSRFIYSLVSANPSMKAILCKHTACWFLAITWVETSIKSDAWRNADEVLLNNLDLVAESAVLGS